MRHDVRRVLEYAVGLQTAGMQRGAQLASAALENLADNAEEANRDLRAIPNDIDIDVDVDSFDRKIRAMLLKQRAALENDLEADVDVDATKAFAKIDRIDRATGPVGSPQC